MYKIAYILNNTNELSSRIFEDLDPALEFAKTTNMYMVMKQLEGAPPSDDHYKWQLLPYGNYRQYDYFLRINEPTQLIRILDVVFIAPVCIFIALKYTNIPMFLRISLFFIGIGTLLFNGIHFLNYRYDK